MNALLRHLSQLYRREVKIHLPWYLAKLKARGEAFVHDYSPAGDAALTLWPCEGDDNNVPAVIGDRHYEYPAHRIYDQGRLKQVFKGLELIEQRYFGPVHKPWVYQPCSRDEAEHIPSSMGYAVTGCTLRKL